MYFLTFSPTAGVEKILKQEGHEALDRSPENGLRLFQHQWQYHQNKLSDKILSCSIQKCNHYSVNKIVLQFGLVTYLLT